jgi:hypothetical protein
LESKGYVHEVTFLKGKKKTPSELMPRLHGVISLLKPWLIGTHQGAVSHKHLDYYLDIFLDRSATAYLTFGVSGKARCPAERARWQRRA